MPRLLALLLVGLIACGQSGASDGDRPAAVATVYPLAWLVEEIAPDMQVSSLAAGGQDPHDLELSPGQRAEVERAALVVYLGDIGFQPQIESAMASAQGEVVAAAEVIGDDALLRDDHGDEVDPHLWFDATLLADVAVAVGDAAAESDQARGQEYQANAEKVADELRTLAQDVDRLLADCAHDQVIVGHEAFAYLLDPHGLEQHGISGAGGHSEASPQDIGDLSAEVRAQGLPAVLSERAEGRADADAVAREAGVDVIEVSSLDIVSQEQAARGFPALLLEQAEAVATAAECGGGTP